MGEGERVGKEHGEGPEQPTRGPPPHLRYNRQLIAAGPGAGARNHTRGDNTGAQGAQLLSNRCARAKRFQRRPLARSDFLANPPTIPNFHLNCGRESISVFFNVMCVCVCVCVSCVMCVLRPGHAAEAGVAF